MGQLDISLTVVAMNSLWQGGYRPDLLAVSLRPAHFGHQPNYNECELPHTKQTSPAPQTQNRPPNPSGSGRRRIQAPVPATLNPR